MPNVGDRGRRGASWVRTRLLVLLVVGAALVAHQARVQAQDTPTPEVSDYRGANEGFEYRGTFTDIALAIDNHWDDVFRAAAIGYDSPDVIPLDRSLLTGCGRHGPERAAFYCPFDQTIYLNPEFLSQQDRLVGDFAPIIVLAHEWGHHVQTLLEIVPGPGNEFELQADCLAGVYSRKAEDQNWLEPGDFLEALEMSESAGDPLSFPQDAPGTHGTYSDRRNAVMRGYLDGTAGCDLPQLGAALPPVVQDSTQSTNLLAWVPNPLPLNHGDCFGIVDDGAENFSQVLARFSGVPDAAERLQSWGWQGSAFRQFGCDGPPEGEAGWIDISVHQFADAASAQAAVDYFTAVRLDGSPHIQGASPGIGDYSTAMSGPAVNGKEFTIYASQGPLLIRVTGVSPSGIPFMNVLAVANAVLGNQQAAPQAVPSQPSQDVGRPAAAYLPVAPGVHYRECFDVSTEGTYSYSEVAAALMAVGLSPVQSDALRWRDGAYIVFTCADPPFGRASQIDVVIHQFGDSQAAASARPYVAGTYNPGRNESRSCDSAESMVICVTGRSLTGSPLSDVAFVLQQVTAGIR